MITPSATRWHTASLSMKPHEANIKRKYIFDTRSEFSLNRTIIFSVSQAFTRSSTMATSGMRENVHLNIKLELCWKILIFII